RWGLPTRSRKEFPTTRHGTHRPRRQAHGSTRRAESLAGGRSVTSWSTRASLRRGRHSGRTGSHTQLPAPEPGLVHDERVRHEAQHVIPLERLQEPRWEHHFAVAPVALAPGARAQRSRHVRGVGPRPIHQDDGTEAAVAHPPPELGGDVRALEREQPQIEWIEHAWPLAREDGQNRVLTQEVVTARP